MVIYDELMKTDDGFEFETNIHKMVYDKNGKYLGQWQDNMLDDDRLSQIFIKSCGEYQYIPDLTQEEMCKALKTYTMENHTFYRLKQWSD